MFKRLTHWRDARLSLTFPQRYTCKALRRVDALLHRAAGRRTFWSNGYLYVRATSGTHGYEAPSFFGSRAYDRAIALGRRFPTLRLLMNL